MKGYVGVLILCMIMGMTGIASADIPNLVGNWTGPYVEYNADTGFADNEGGFFFLNITEQQDRIFTGYSLYVMDNGTPVTKNLAGVISIDGTELSLAEQNNGYSTGKILGPDSLELTYLSDNDPISVAVDQFNRAL